VAASVKVLRPAQADLNRRKSLRTPDGIVRPHHRYRAEKASSLSASSTPPRTSNNGRRIVFFTWTGFDEGDEVLWLFWRCPKGAESPAILKAPTETG
jgi:hypothetical protein